MKVLNISRILKKHASAIGVHFITLIFLDKNIEKKFRNEYFKKSLVAFRISFIVLMLLYSAFGYLDYFTSHEFYKGFFLIRYLIVLPFLLAVFLFSFNKFFEKIWQGLISVCYFMGGAGIIYMLLKNPDNIFYYGGMFLIFAAGYFFIKLRFLAALIPGVSLIIIYNIGSFLYQSVYDIQFDYILSTNAFYISANIISLIALYNIEFLERKDFYQKILLTETKNEITLINQSLEAKVNARTKLLDERNTNLLVEISQRKKVENELLIAKKKAEESEEKLNLALNGADAGLWSWNIKTGEDLLDERWCRILGYKKEEIKQEVSSWESLIHPEDKEGIMEVVRKHFEDEKNEYNHEYRLKCKNGDWKWIHAMGKIVERDAEGEPARMTGIIIDIDNHKQAEKALLESEERFELAMTATKDGLYDWNLITNEIYYSPGWKRMLGFEDKELPNDFSFWEKLIEAEVAEKSWKMQQDLINKKRDRFELEIKMKHKDGHWIDILSRSEAVFDKNGKAIRIVGTHVDISDRKQIEIELNAAKDKAEESDRLKSAFLANMSHEIRTPMNGILGFTDLLKEPKLSGKEQEKYIGIIESSGQRLLNTVNDLIDISKIEAGQMKVSVSDVNLSKLLEQLFAFFNVEAQKKGLQLFLSTTSLSENIILLSDQEKLYSILTNLIKNAIKYTRSGSIDFGFEKKGDELQFFVKDTGDGISENRLNVIFDRFIRSDLHEDDASEGSGLGLSISKAYVKMLGGKIWAESKEGEGSQFYFTIPYKTLKSKNPENKEADSETKSKHQIKDLKILIAEDEESGFDLLSVLLKDVSKEILCAKTGVETVEQCRNNQDIDLVLMDIQMPIMNGYEASKQIREFNKDVIIIAQTAFALAGDREKALEAGCNDYISKPIKKEILNKKLQKFFD